MKSHVGRVLTKLRLRDRAQAVAAAYQNGLVVVRATRWATRASPRRFE